MKKRNIVILSNILVLSMASLFAMEFYTEKDVLDAKTHAFALYNISKKDEALKILNNVPRGIVTEDMFLVKANILEDKNDIEGAYKNLNLALLVNPKSHKAYYNLGLLALKENNIDLAIENFKKSIKYNRNFAYSHYNLASCYIKQEKYDLAKKELIKAIQLVPEKDFYYNLAYVYKKLNREKDAKKILESYNKLRQI